MDILQVQTKEDDFQTDFYEDLIPLENSKDQQATGFGQEKSSFHVPIFYSSKKSQTSSHNSAFKQAIQASHKKVKKWFLSFYSFLEISPNCRNHARRREFLISNQ